MKVCVSGGAGFVGSHLCDACLERGDQVWCVDNLLTGSLDNISQNTGRKGFVFMRADVVSLEPASLPGNFDLVFHLASPASPMDYTRHPIETLAVNSLGTERMLLVAKRSGAKFLFASTSEVYGDPEIPVQDESYWGRVNPIGERSMYDEGKRFGEALVMAYHRQHKLDTRIVRIFNTYGARMRMEDGRVIPNFICQALSGKPMTVYGDGKQTRSFCHVSDLVRGLTAMMETDFHLPVNLGNPDEFTVLELVDRVRFLLGKDVPVVFRPPMPDDPRRRRPDIRRAKELLGWEPRVTLEEGLRKTIPYFQERIFR